jgi:hypothetical protein
MADMEKLILRTVCFVELAILDDGFRSRLTDVDGVQA